MAVIKNNKTGFWEVRTYYKDLSGNRKQKTKRGQHFGGAAMKNSQECYEKDIAWGYSVSLKADKTFHRCRQ